MAIIILFKYIITFRQGATSTLAGFHASPLSWVNENLEVFDGTTSVGSFGKTI